jgi:hypothetical protein
MQILNSSQVSLRCILLALSLLVPSVFISMWSIYAQSSSPCPEYNPNLPGFRQGDRVYIEVGVQVPPDIASQVHTGFESWNIANQSYNNSNVQFIHNRPPDSAPQGVSIVHVVYQPITTGYFGEIDYNTVATFQPVRYDSSTGILYEATLIINSEARVIDAEGYVTSTRYYDSSLQGYDTVFKK